MKTHSLLRRIRMVCLAVLFAIGSRMSSTVRAAEPIKVIFDTDMAEDVDDVGALALLHALARRGEAEILACGISSRNEFTGPCLDAINTFNGRPDIPIGNVRNFQNGYPRAIDEGATPSRYAEAVARGFPHDLLKSSDAPDAARLYRKILALQPEASVTIISVGFLTNLRNLLDSEKDEQSALSGEQLIKAKVRQWVCMGGLFPGGRFPNGGGEYNVTIDTIASVRVINDWPTPVVFSGFEIGSRIFTGAGLRERPGPNPIRMAYEQYNGLKNRESWDQTAVLYAVRGARDYWTLSEPGVCLMHARVPHGLNEWFSGGHQRHRYLVEKMSPADLGKTIEGLMMEGP